MLGYIHQPIKELIAITAMIKPPGELPYTPQEIYEAQELENAIQNIQAAIHGGYYKSFYHHEWRPKLQIHDKIEFVCKNLNAHGYLMRRMCEWPEISNDLYTVLTNLYNARGARCGKLSDLYKVLCAKISEIKTDNLTADDIQFAKNIIFQVMQEMEYVPNYSTEFKKNISQLCEIYNQTWQLNTLWRWPKIWKKMYKFSSGLNL